MNIEKILQASTHFEVSAHGISFYESDTCAHCGAIVHTNQSPWLTFNGVSIEECETEAVHIYGMKKITEVNDSWYCEDTPTNESCNECGGL